MEILTKENIRILAQEFGKNLISLYLPTHRVGREMQQDPVRLKNILTKARERLQARGLRKPEIHHLLKSADNLLLDSYFWQHQSDGLAVFVTTKYMNYYRLPLKFEELLMIGERFHLKPLLPLLARNGHFYVLALSQKQVRLFEGSLYSIDEIKLDDTPTSLHEALRFEDPERQLQYHTGTSSPGHAGARPALFHGQGVSEDDSKTNLLRYFQKINQGLMELLGNEVAPLVLAGVEYLLSIYKKANNYPNMVQDFIEGNPDDISAAALHQQAWDIVEPIFHRDQQQAETHYHELIGSDSNLASNHFKSIIPAAYHGRVDTLFVALGEQLWGSFDASTNTVELHQEFHPGDQDLLDFAAVQTLLNGGKVYALDPDDMPDEAPLSSIFRYTLE